MIVKSPFKQGLYGPERLGESKGQAIARFLQLERKLARDKTLREEYTKVMHEYIDLCHIRDVTYESNERKKYFIPHHAIAKPDHLTTNVRAVFDASAKTSTGYLLNECMHIGARQQRDLNEILMSWRMYETVYKANITKMYRMIRLDEEDQQFHTVVWRDSPKEKLNRF